MSLWNQADGQLGLGANGIEPRRIENHQSLLEQRMRDIDKGVAPFRHLDHPVRANAGIVFRMVVVPEAEEARIVLGHMAYLGDFFHRLRQLRRIIHIQINARPLFGHHPPFHERLALQACLYRQQPKTGRHGGVVAKLRRAHGRASGARWHDAATIAGKKDRIDQL